MPPVAEVMPAGADQAESKLARETLNEVRAFLEEQFDMTAMASALRDLQPGADFDLARYERPRQYAGFVDSFQPHFYKQSYDDEQGSIRLTRLERFDCSQNTLLAGRTLFDKREDTHESVRAFKARGALFGVLEALEQNPSIRVFTTGSAGNHAQGLLAAVNLLNRSLVASGAVRVDAKGKVVEADRHLLFQAHVHCSSKISQVKRDNLLAGGATLVDTYGVLDGAISGAKEYAERHKTIAAFIHPYDDERVMAGQGTIALETLFQLKTQGVDILSRPLFMRVGVGGGGLFTGNAAVFSWAIEQGLLHPDSRVIAGEPEDCDSAARQIEGRAALTAKTIDMDADGLATLEASVKAVAAIEAYSPGGVRVLPKYYLILAADMLTDAHDGRPPELSGVIGLAQTLYEAENGMAFQQDAVEVAVTSGGNITPELVQKLSDEFKLHENEQVLEAARRLGYSVFRLISDAHLKQGVWVPAENPTGGSRNKGTVLSGTFIRHREEPVRVRLNDGRRAAASLAMREQMEQMGVSLL